MGCNCGQRRKAILEARAAQRAKAAEAKAEKQAEQARLAEARKRAA